ncbi:Na+-dependent transporter [Pseudolabrys taiwanensis]|uniref:Na+-dependent transporter n=1 Tax=Pseudolabrys taiwanensis TaxID=331696 RepID=A0A345ZQU4_9HYPH|nr:Na+-dependent transporter [Pseudolabrys taiwanensis]AXK79291.1 Na+-dependent transporter [Pseudolabrys taiwanensis]
MPILNTLVAALSWIGRTGTRGLAVSIFLGLAVPQLAAYVKPYLSEIVFILLLFSYLRTDPQAFRGYLRAPALPAAAALWVMVALPLLICSIYALSGARSMFPDLYALLILHMVVAPLTSSAAFAALMGLDVALSLMVLIVSSALSPITSVAFSYLFLGTSLFSPIGLGVKLFFFYAASGVIAFVIRRTAGQAWIEKQRQPIDGLNMIALFAFAIVAMENVPRNVMADPLFALGILGFVVALACAQLALTAAVFARVGIDRSMAIGFCAAFRNLGVVMAALGSSISDVAWFYFALVQLPIYVLPAVVNALAKRGRRVSTP